jgi:hypothetical protein
MAVDASNIADYLSYIASFPDWPQNATALAAVFDEATEHGRSSRSIGLEVLCYVTLVLVILVVPARLIVRARMRSSFGLDDVLIIPATV